MKKNKKIWSVFIYFIVICNLLLNISMPQTYKSNALTVAEGKAECVMEATSRRVLYQNHGDIRLPMASTTKIATCATVLELCDDLQAEVKIPLQAVGIEGSSVYLKEGDIYTVEDLLYGLMLRSGNDCATALALHCCGSIGAFAAQMNAYAQKAGALNTNFENPHGLPSKNHYTTAFDLSLITCLAMQNPVFRTIVSTTYYEKRHWKNKNKMLGLYEHAIGVKTGYTKEAGRCLVSAAKRDNMTVICTVLGCSTTYERSISLLNDAFSAYRYKKVLSKDEKIRLTNEKGEFYAVSKQDLYYPLLAEEEALVELVATAYSKGDFRKKRKDCVGEFSIYLAKRLLFSGILYKL